MKKSELFWQTYIGLEKEIIEISKYIYISDEKTYYDGHKIITESCNTQLETFSPHIADVLIRTCVEIEAISKELYFELGGQKQRGDTDLFFDEDCLKLIDIKCKTHNKVVAITCPLFNLTKDENRYFKPLREAHKRQGADWERAYQAVKHDRYSSISKGNIKCLLHAMGALFLLNLYYRDIKQYVKFLEVDNLDFSFGSSIFSVMKPDHKYVVEVINNNTVEEILESGKSPFILKYTDSQYQEVLDANQKMIDAEKDYIQSQQELQEPAFQKQIAVAMEKERKDSSQKMIPLWELCKYRLNKKIPSALPFEEKKQLFVNSSEWKGRIRQNNNHLTEEELTDDNIQDEINTAGILAGMELQQRFENIKMIKAFNEGYCELVIDKGNVKYNAKHDE